MPEGKISISIFSVWTTSFNITCMISGSRFELYTLYLVVTGRTLLMMSQGWAVVDRIACAPATCNLLEFHSRSPRLCLCAHMFVFMLMLTLKLFQILLMRGNGGLTWMYRTRMRRISELRSSRLWPIQTPTLYVAIAPETDLVISRMF